jgi:hypothetical protein
MDARYHVKAANLNPAPRSYRDPGIRVPQQSDKVEARVHLGAVENVDSPDQAGV